MANKVVLIADPGIDTAFAIALALADPSLDVVGVIACEGNVPAQQATRNVYALVGMIDPPKWPRVGAALPFGYEFDGERLHGPGGLGGLSLPDVTPHQIMAGDRLLADLVDQHPGELTLVNLGPCSLLAAALEREPDLDDRLRGLVLAGGAWRVTGNATPAAEFHFRCDPAAARRALRAGCPVSVVPLDVMRELVISPGDLMRLPERSTAGGLLRKMVPAGIRASSHLYGIEGFHLKDVTALAAAARPRLVRFADVWAEVEVAGELTAGMLVVDDRPTQSPPPNIRLANAIDEEGARAWIAGVLGTE